MKIARGKKGVASGVEEKRSKDLSQPAWVLLSVLAVSKNGACSRDRSNCPDSFPIQLSIMSWIFSELVPRVSRLEAAHRLRLLFSTDIVGDVIITIL